MLERLTVPGPDAPVDLVAAHIKEYQTPRTRLHWPAQTGRRRQRRIARMNYESVVAASFQASPPDAVSTPTVQASPARRLRDAIEPIAMHSVWSRATNERLAEMDLDFLTGYVWGRAAALGEPDAGVVVAAFAVFEPGLVRDAYEQGRRACPRDRLLAARTDATVASLLETLEGADVTPVADVLKRAVSVADGTGRPLFSGLAGQPWPADPVGRLWRACELVREHRGDSHVAACISRGLGPVDMNILTDRSSRSLKHSGLTSSP